MTSSCWERSLRFEVGAGAKLCYKDAVPETLILILFVALLILALGLPLLVGPDSLVPDIVAFGILTVVVLGFAWGTGAWWILLPILALVAFVVWLERGGDRQAPENGSGGGNGWTSRTTLRFRLWRAANRLQLALIACVLAFSATGFALTAVMPLIAWMVVAMVAAAAFRFSFYRACRHDRRTLAGAAEAMETVA